MKPVIVDNGTIHLGLLMRLCGGDVKVVRPDQLAGLRLSTDNLLVLSGSHTRPVLGNEDYFADELDLIETAPCAIIGVCLGFELIAYQAGSELQRLPYREHGVVEIFPSPEGMAWFDAYHLPVAEGHRWVLTEPPPGYLELARSTDGVEAIANLTRRIVGFQFHPESGQHINDGEQLFAKVKARLAELA